jgi:hypothetical protein
MEMALQMPSNYVEVTEDEMMYVDGGGIGKHWYNKVGVVSTGLDVALIAITGGVAISSTVALKKFVKSNRKKLIKTVEGQLYKMIGSAAAGYASTAIDIALVVGGTSIGSMIAEGFDRADGKNDGYLFA